MKLICEVVALAQAAVPWSTPDIGMSRRPGKAAHRFAKKDPRLVGWQAYVRARAEAAMARAGKRVGPVCVEMVFARATADIALMGKPWTVEVVWDDDSFRYSKKGKAADSPDLTNLFKAAEDAITGVVIVNDCQVCMTVAKRVYGPASGVTIRVWSIEPDESPRTGQDVGP